MSVCSQPLVKRYPGYASLDAKAAGALVADVDACLAACR